MAVTYKIIPRFVVAYSLFFRFLRLLISQLKAKLSSQSVKLSSAHLLPADPPYKKYIAKTDLSMPVKRNSSLYLPQKQAGFTLVEILVVVVILSIFAGMMSLSVSSSDSRKNRAFYEHLTDSLDYVRLLSAERMQPMGLSLQPDQQGQISPVIVTLSNPYVRYQTPINPNNTGSRTKNSMELSADISGLTNNGDKTPTPSWVLEPEVSLPSLPDGVSLSIQRLDASSSTSISSPRGMTGLADSQVLQPWFTGQTVPQVLWFGTGQATPVTIEVRANANLVGEVITIMPDGSIKIGQRS
ncbi:prepilin-type N-terminal cleavage/methylation domain-containing protein [Psychrobacter sp. M13]|uniref:prepilin-type N-terminal cleavage/methylation domain-containing protein n=1 Tax=Psychrobacter sp. M13 TaxID=3067275 RepID=UPI00273B19BB|nr:prepilin-type N-terminal cleavage/methylation domain-containing protein [Psychrobacter sp. M13]WLP93685.1 prepilin-type N-terminal cleavage/methylation domain-containing protein [Psychrobacter sp. M13]